MKRWSSAINCLLLLSVTLAFLFLGSSLFTVTVNVWYNPGSGSVHLFSLTCISGLATSNTIFLHSSLESNATASSLFWTSWPFIYETNESGTLVSISTKQHTIKGRYQLICAECMDNENCATGSSSAPSVVSAFTQLCAYCKSCIDRWRMVDIRGSSYVHKCPTCALVTYI